MSEILVPRLGRSESAALLHNPKSGNGDSLQQVERLAMRLEDYGWNVVIYPTQAPGHATEIAARANSRGHDIVLTAGGDGIFREAAKGVLDTGMPVTQVPYGTVCVFAAETGIPRDPDGAAAAILNGRVVSMDTGVVNGEPYVLNAGFIMDAEVFRDVQEPGKPKRARGLGAYLVPVAKTVPMHKGVKGLIAIGGENIEDQFTQIWAGNTQKLGLMTLRPEAYADDGTQEFTIFTGKRGYQMVPHFFAGAIRQNGQRPRSYYRQGKEMYLYLDKEVAVQADGDALHRARVIQTRVVPDSLKVIVPEVALTRGEHMLFSRSRILV